MNFLVLTFVFPKNLNYQPNAPSRCTQAAARPGFRFGGGNILGGRPGRGSGGRSPLDAEKFSKIRKKTLKKFTINAQFQLFFKKVNEFCVTFSRIWTKNTIVRETFEKILKVSLWKQQKMHYFGLFSTEILKPRVNFSRVWTKKQIVRKF